ncbi:MAG: DUF4407 domain-containing protein [Flavobacteriia bacterium]|nr:DUF4407 domain-containing protein [Flavobacteriia bacterium]
MHFFWKISGGDAQILEKATYSDQVKYMTLGGIVLATGVMAALAGGYAFYTIFSPKGLALEDQVHYPTSILSIIFGILWGLMIFNIDRFIVTSTGKGDGTEKITSQELKSAIPRIIMGAIIAITISKPIEIRMFQSEINTELHQAQMEQREKYDQSIREKFKEKIDRNANDIAKFENEINDKTERLKDLEKQYIEEARIITVGPRAVAIKAQMDKVQSEIDTDKNNSEYQRLLQEKKEIEDQYELERADSEKVANGLDGLLERIKLSHKVAGFWITLFITLLFLSIELTPIFFKLMLVQTPYDYLAENRDELIRAENGIEVKFDYYKDKEGFERHLIINHEADKLLFEKAKMTEIQKELTEYAIERYKEKEKQNIDENLDEYIKKVNPDESEA